MSNAAKKSLTNAWTLRIATALLRSGPLRFNALERAIDAPHPPMLSMHLKKMARDGLIVREVVQVGPPAVVRYHLTPLGRDLAGPASAMVTWVDSHMAEVEVARERSRVLVAQQKAAENADADHTAAAIA